MFSRAGKGWDACGVQMTAEPWLSPHNMINLRASWNHFSSCYIFWHFTLTISSFSDFFFHVASLLNSRCWKRRDIKYPKAQLLQSSSSQIKSGSKSLYVKMSTTVDLLENWILSVVKERFPNYWIFWTGLFIYCCHFKGLKAALWIFILAFSSYSGNTYLLNTTADFLC